MDNDRDLLKTLWNEAKINMVLHCDGPTEYPVMPTMLIDTHPGVYIRAYARDDQPTSLWRVLLMMLSISVCRHSGLNISMSCEMQVINALAVSKDISGG